MSTDKETYILSECLDRGNDRFVDEQSNRLSNYEYKNI